MDERSVIDACAAALFEAEVQRRPIAPPTQTWPGLGATDAYRVQQRNVERRIEGGWRLVGHKIGLTSKVMQQQFHVNEPDYGHLLDAMVLEAGQPLDLGELIDPHIEVEPAFVLGRPLAGPGITPEDVIAATDYVTACFEVIDSRVVDWRITLPDTVADNGSSSRLLLGAQRIRPGDARLDSLDTELELDGKVAERGNTSAILDHPARGIAWLANRIGEFSMVLEPGHVVLPGTCTRARRIYGRRRLCGRIDTLGAVELEVIGVPAVTGKPID